MHGSTKVHLTSVAIRIRIQIFDPDRHQNLIICSLSHCLSSLKISCKSISKFFCAKLLTDRQTTNDENITSLAEVMLNMYSMILCNSLFYVICISFFNLAVFCTHFDVVKKRRISCVEIVQAKL